MPQNRRVCLVLQLAPEAPIWEDSRLHLELAKVKGDGSCWLYAVLRCLGILEGKKCRPTTGDQAMDLLLRGKFLKWLEDHPSADSVRISILSLDVGVHI